MKNVVKIYVGFKSKVHEYMIDNIFSVTGPT